MITNTTLEWVLNKKNKNIYFIFFDNNLGNSWKVELDEFRPTKFVNSLRNRIFVVDMLILIL